MKSKRKQQTGRGPMLLAILGGALLIVAAIALLAAPKTPQTEDDVPRISLLDSYKAYQDGNAVFVDVRDRDAYGTNRIPGAVNIPAALVESRMGELDKNAWIITYCT